MLFTKTSYSQIKVSYGNKIHKDVFIEVQTKYISLPYRYVYEKIYSKCTLDMNMQAILR